MRSVRHLHDLRAAHTAEAFIGGVTMNVIGVLMEAGRTGRAVRVRLIATPEVVVGYPVEYRVGGSGNSVVIRRDHSTFGDAGRLLSLTSIARVELMPVEDPHVDAALNATDLLVRQEPPKRGGPSIATNAWEEASGRPDRRR